MFQSQFQSYPLSFRDFTQFCEYDKPFLIACALPFVFSLFQSRVSVLHSSPIWYMIRVCPSTTTLDVVLNRSRQPFRINILYRFLAIRFYCQFDIFCQTVLPGSPTRIMTMSLLNSNQFRIVWIMSKLCHKNQIRYSLLYLKSNFLDSFLLLHKYSIALDPK